jgi:ferrous iron transport protein A
MKDGKKTLVVVEGQCAGPALCPLSEVRTGAVVCIKQFSTPQELTDRLREMGLCEEQRIKLVRCKSNYICQVCNARLGISEELAENILVEPLPDSIRAGGA